MRWLTIVVIVVCIIIQEQGARGNTIRSNTNIDDNNLNKDTSINAETLSSTKSPDDVAQEVAEADPNSDNKRPNTENDNIENPNEKSNMKTEPINDTGAASTDDDVDVSKLSIRNTVLRTHKKVNTNQNLDEASNTRTHLVKDTTTVDVAELSIRTHKKVKVDQKLDENPSTVEDTRAVCSSSADDPNDDVDVSQLSIRTNTDKRNHKKAKVDQPQIPDEVASLTDTNNDADTVCLSVRDVLKALKEERTSLKYTLNTGVHLDREASKIALIITLIIVIVVAAFLIALFRLQALVTDKPLSEPVEKSLLSLDETIRKVDSLVHNENKSYGYSSIVIGGTLLTVLAFAIDATAEYAAADNSPLTVVTKVLFGRPILEAIVRIALISFLSFLFSYIVELVVRGSHVLTGNTPLSHAQVILRYQRSDILARSRTPGGEKFAKMVASNAASIYKLVTYQEEDVSKIDLQAVKRVVGSEKEDAEEVIPVGRITGIDESNDDCDADTHGHTRAASRYREQNSRLANHRGA